MSTEQNSLKFVFSTSVAIYFYDKELDTLSTSNNDIGDKISNSLV